MEAKLFSDQARSGVHDIALGLQSVEATPAWGLRQSDAVGEFSRRQGEDALDHVEDAAVDFVRFKGGHGARSRKQLARIPNP
ncbi:hypothetical protein D3C86_1560410 [compost metagenome]